MANNPKDIPELSATQQKDFESRFGLDPLKEHRLSLDGLPLVIDEYFDDTPAMMRPEPPEDFSPEFKKEITKTLEIIKAITMEKNNE